jgi:hypothetical protein
MARRIESELPDVQVVQFDDFYVDTIDKTIDRKIGDHFDWIRLREEVLVPLTQKREANYQVYDWELGRLHSWKTVSPHGIVVIDGIYSTRSELRHFYNLTVFVYAEYNVRLQRGIDRDGTNSRSKWVQEWMPVTSHINLTQIRALFGIAKSVDFFTHRDARLPQARGGRLGHRISVAARRTCSEVTVGHFSSAAASNAPRARFPARRRSPPEL